MESVIDYSQKVIDKLRESKRQWSEHAKNQMIEQINIWRKDRYCSNAAIARNYELVIYTSHVDKDFISNYIDQLREAEPDWDISNLSNNKIQIIDNKVLNYYRSEGEICNLYEDDILVREKYIATAEKKDIAIRTTNITKSVSTMESIIEKVRDFFSYLPEISLDDTARIALRNAETHIDELEDEFSTIKDETCLIKTGVDRLFYETNVLNNQINDHEYRLSKLEGKK